MNTNATVSNLTQQRIQNDQLLNRGKRWRIAQALSKTQRELDFLEKNWNEIFLHGRAPQDVPEIPSLKRLMEEFRLNRDYYSISQRIKELKRKAAKLGELKTVNNNPVICSSAPNNRLLRQVAKYRKFEELPVNAFYN